MRVQTFRPQAPVERFDEGVVGRFAWPREVQRDAPRIRPEIETSSETSIRRRTLASTSSGVTLRRRTPAVMPRDYDPAVRLQQVRCETYILYGS